MSRKRTVILALALTGCATHTGDGAPSAVRSWDIDATFEQVWDATLTALSESGHEVTVESQATGTIETASRRVGEAAQFANCEAPYWVRLRVTVGEGVTGTRLSIDPEFTNRGDPGGQTCSTTGELERALSRRVIESAR